MPDALELPGMLRAVVPLMRGEGLARLRGRVVGELVALAFREAFRGLFQHTSRRLPRLAAVAGALDDLSEPPARLRRVQPVRVDRRALEVVDLPARAVRATDIPPFPLAVRRQDERALARTDQDSYSAHGSLPLKGPRFKVFVERAGVKSGQSVFLPVFARSRSSCSRNSGLSASPKSSASNNWRIST